MNEPQPAVRAACDVLELLKTELGLLRQLEGLVRQIDSTRRGCTTWPEVRQVLAELEASRKPRNTP